MKMRHISCSLTDVGTKDISRKIFSTAPQLICIFFSYISLLAAETLLHLEASSTRTTLVRCAMSRGFPRLCIWCKGTRQCGHGYFPRFLMLASKILPSDVIQWLKHYKISGQCILFRVICRVSKYSGMELTQNAIEITIPWSHVSNKLSSRSMALPPAVCPDANSLKAAGSCYNLLTLVHRR